MEGFGPVDGTPVHCGLLIIGNDPVATDAVAARIMGFSPKSVPHLNYAAKQGIGNIDSMTVGESISFNFKFIPIIVYVACRLALKFQRYVEYLRNLQILVRRTRSASSSVGLSYIRRKLTIDFAIRNIKNWIFKKDG